MRKSEDTENMSHSDGQQWMHIHTEYAERCTNGHSRCIVGLMFDVGGMA